MKAGVFNELVNELRLRGYGHEPEWQESLKPCTDPWHFARETIWVILNSGMREQIARIISDRIYLAINEGRDISNAFGHKGKVAAIKHVLNCYGKLFSEYTQASDRITYLQTIPFIGKITCWHLAKNLGEDCVKPDRHLVRIASQFHLSPDGLCEKLSRETGYRKCTIDIVLWRAANLRLI